MSSWRLCFRSLPPWIGESLMSPVVVGVDLKYMLGGHRRRPLSATCRISLRATINIEIDRHTSMRRFRRDRVMIDPVGLLKVGTP